jgi:hypothetical protein
MSKDYANPSEISNPLNYHKLIFQTIQQHVLLQC